jgi:hypothetical protein
MSEVRESFGPSPVGFNTFGWMIEDLPAALAAESIVAYFSRQCRAEQPLAATRLICAQH